MNRYIVFTFLLASCAFPPKKNTQRGIASDLNGMPAVLTTPPPKVFELRTDFSAMSCEIGKILNPSGREKDIEHRREKASNELKRIDKEILSQLEMKYEHENWLMNKAADAMTNSADFYISDSLVVGARSGLKGEFTIALQKFIEQEKQKNQKYNAINDPDLANKVRRFQMTQDFSQDKSLSSLSEEPKYRAILEYRTHFDNLSRVSSPLAEWILLEPKYSISPTKLLVKATEIYDDPWIALGVIGWLTAWSLGTPPRDQFAVLSSRMSPIFKQTPQDHSGTIYHFWGYLTRILLKPTDLHRLAFVSYSYEMGFQNDPQDFYADYWGLKLGNQINISWSKSGNQLCPNESSVLRRSEPSDKKLEPSITPSSN